MDFLEFFFREIENKISKDSENFPKKPINVSSKIKTKQSLPHSTYKSILAEQIFNHHIEKQ
jgi:hypothetical protein